MEMKRINIVIIILSVMIISCDSNNWADSIITNNSLYPVKFKFNHTGEKNLAIGENITFETAAYQHLQSYSPNKRVYFSYKSTNEGYTGEFDTRSSFEIRVNNSIDQNVTLSTNDWINNNGKWNWMDENGEWINTNDKLNTWMDIMENISPGDTDDESHRGIIYTEDPVFIVTKPGNENPPIIIGIAKYNKIGSTLWVTIQNFP